VRGTLALDHAGARDALGAEVSSAVARLWGGTGRSASLSSGAAARWSRDIDLSWSGHLSAGGTYVRALSGPGHWAVVPTGTVGLGFSRGDVGTSIGAGYGPSFDLQTGSTTQAASASIQARLDLAAPVPRQLGASAGYRRTWSMGDVTGAGSAGVGSALQGDLGVLWGLSRDLLLMARASVAYQYGQAADLPASLALSVTVGLTGRYASGGRMGPLPTTGSRVDARDAVKFPGAEAGAAPQPER
jgi:hypothetical protein